MTRLPNRTTTGTSAHPAPAPEPASWQQERDQLLSLLAQQQRIAQAGLITAGLAHDVNNYVMVISGNAGLALGSANPTAWREALDKIQTQCRELADTTQAFLGFVKRQTSAPGEVFRVGEAIRQACRLVRPLAHGRRVQVEHTIIEDAVIAGEAQLLTQALVNILSNATRACPEGIGQIRITAAPILGGNLRVEVSDNGPGIPEDLRRRIFQPLATGHADTGGHGMGLFVVRQSIRRLGGSIRVRTSPKGTSFQIDLPRP